MAWDEGQRGFTLAVEGLADEGLWKRPHTKLPSIAR